MSSPSLAATPDQQKVVEGFQKLREQQQSITAEIGRVEGELREHQTVLKTVEALNDERRCFRQIGDTMFEHPASEMTEILGGVIKRFKERLEELANSLIEKGKELNAYKEKHNIRFMTQKEVMEIQKKQALEKVSQIGKA